MSMEIRTMVRLKLEKWVNGGFTIAHWEGKPVFVVGGIPGEVVMATFSKILSSHAFARVDTVLEASEKRIAQDCSIFLGCGGCCYRHIPYSEEILIKKQLLGDLLRVDQQSIAVFSGNPEFYRNTVQWKLKNGERGFFEKFSNEWIGLPVTKDFPKGECRTVRKEILSSNLEAKNVRISEYSQDLIGVIDYDIEIAKLEVAGRFIEITPKGFLQINSGLLEIWMNSIRSALTTENIVLELFSGSGCISVGVADAVQYLYGLEVEKRSVKFAKQNASKNGFRNLEFAALDLFRNSFWKTLKRNFDVVIANPPRTGLGKIVVADLLQMLPEKIVYSSCNSITLKRDLNSLLHFYSLESTSLFDFFPRTEHYEVLVVLSRK